ncbi:PepSY-associated TM helix domain-containing protein [Marinobacter shengliensis]|uniref:PepSY-associated TM helix domain-containing protein n=1 Tax=Marinobacter shengliensis TaxID=1389223 RepID=UPI002573291E|nr:PepSY-associated TM helix domain-containing protein [Marinobacter shengliensis]BEH15551.1 membrane protein [Marinobacter shengliensis]
MKDFFRQSMAWLHTWVGLLLAWVLYFMFVTGTAGYLDTEIDRWMMPEAPVADYASPSEQTLKIATDYLSEHAPQAQRWFIGLPLDRNTPYPRVFWNGARGEGIETTGNLQLDLATGMALAARDTAGGQTLYQMHWRMHYLPRSISDWIVGVSTMFMFVALITGVIVHKKIFKDFFTFRPGKGQRSWLDAHNVLSVVSLPFQLMITWSGLIFMMFIYMPLIVVAWYGSESDGGQAFIDDVFTPPALVEANSESAPLVAIDTLIAEAQHLWGNAPIASLDIHHPNNANARIIMRGNNAAGPLNAADVLVFDGVSGELLAEQPALHSNAKGFRDLMLGLHEGLFAGPLLRALYVLSGLLGAGMIATGLVLWSVKRRQRVEKAQQTPHLGLRLVENLNVATIIGLPVAIAAYFWANRLLPLDMTNRADWEVHSLFLVWLTMFLHAVLRPTHRAWQEQAWLAAGAFALLPLLNALTTDRHLGNSLFAGDWVMAGFDLAVLALGLGFAALAKGLHAKSAKQSPLQAEKALRDQQVAAPRSAHG